MFKKLLAIFHSLFGMVTVATAAVSAKEVEQLIS